MIPAVIKEIPGCEMIEMNIQVDHIHMVMVIPPKYSVSQVVGKIKGVTASRLRKRFTWLTKRYRREEVVWSPGYFVSTVGVDEDKIIKYVRWQEHQDSGQAKLEL
jgi:putative transposase